MGSASYRVEQVTDVNGDFDSCEIIEKSKTVAGLDDDLISQFGG